MSDNRAKCLVCGWTIEDGGQEVDACGEIVVVCCDECAAKVGENPAKFAEAR